MTKPIFTPDDFPYDTDGGYAAIANEKIRPLVDALEFYADQERWDLEQTTPTIWDDGNVDLGNRAKQALAKARGDG